jgi:hypothetical protein
MTIQCENVSLCAERFDAGVLTDTRPVFSRTVGTHHLLENSIAPSDRASLCGLVPVYSLQGSKAMTTRRIYSSKRSLPPLSLPPGAFAKTDQQHRYNVDSIFLPVTQVLDILHRTRRFVSPAIASRHAPRTNLELHRHVSSERICARRSPRGYPTNRTGSSLWGNSATVSAQTLGDSTGAAATVSC